MSRHQNREMVISFRISKKDAQALRDLIRRNESEESPHQFARTRCLKSIQRAVRS